MRLLHACFSTQFKSDGISISLHTTKIILSGIHENLETSFRATRALYTAAELFKQYGFYIGIDRIVSEAKIPKATFITTFTQRKAD